MTRDGGLRSVFPVMGTVVSLVVPGHAMTGVGEDAARDAMAALRADLDAAEARFSHFRPDSEASRIARGEPVTPSSEMAEVLAACAELEADSGGAFRARRPDGRLDTAGYVKGWAAQRSTRRLDAAGLAHWCLGVGGDVVTRGRARPDRPWRVAVRDPARDRGVAAVLAAPSDEVWAVATSGRYERGDHVWAADASASARVASFTVTGPDLARADAYATVGLALGARDGLAWVARHPGFEAMAVLADGARPCTAGLPAVDGGGRVARAG
jgi:thiamine biosynthesis lipoprotein